MHATATVFDADAARLASESFGKKLRGRTRRKTEDGIVEAVNTNGSYEVRVPGRSHSYPQVYCIIPNLRLTVGQGCVIGFLEDNPDLAVIIAAKLVGRHATPAPTPELVIAGWQQIAVSPLLNHFAGPLAHYLQVWSGETVPQPADTLRTGWVQVADLLAHDGKWHGLTREGSTGTWWILDVEGNELASTAINLGSSPVWPTRSYLDAGAGLATWATPSGDLYVSGLFAGRHQVVRSNPLVGLFRPGLTFAGPWAIVPSGSNRATVTESPAYLRWTPPGPSSPFLDATLAAFAGGDLWTQLNDGDPEGTNAKCHLLRRDSSGQWRRRKEVSRWQDIPANHSIRSCALAPPVRKTPEDPPEWLIAVAHHERLEKRVENFPIVYGRWGPDFGLYRFTSLPQSMPSNHSFRYETCTTKACFSLVAVALEGGTSRRLHTTELAPEPEMAGSIAPVEAAVSAAYPFEAPTGVTNLWLGLIEENELNALQITRDICATHFGNWPNWHFFAGGWSMLPAQAQNLQAKPDWVGTSERSGGGITYERLTWLEALKPKAMVVPTEVIQTYGDPVQKEFKLLLEAATWRSNAVIKVDDLGEATIVDRPETVTIRQTHPEAGEIQFEAIVPYEVHQAVLAVNQSEAQEKRYCRVRDTLQHSEKSDPSNILDWRPPKQIVEVWDADAMTVLAELDLQDHALLTADVVNQSAVVYARAGQDFEWLHTVPFVRTWTFGGRVYLAIECVATRQEDYRAFGGAQRTERRDYWWVYDITEGAELISSESYTNVDSLALFHSRANSDIPNLSEVAWTVDWAHYPLKRFTGDTELRRQRGIL